MPSPLKPTPPAKRTPSPLPGAQPVVIHPTLLEQEAAAAIVPASLAPQGVTSALTNLQHGLGYMLPAYLARAQAATQHFVLTVARG